MTELASVRTEIKAWERSFKESNGRAATVEDVRQNSAITDKYKLYKKLSKATTATNVNEKEKTLPRFSTPPRPTRAKEPPSVLLSKSRVVQSTAPLAAFNPFSPQKKQKGREKERLSPVEEPRRNLFGTSGSTSSSQGRSLSPLPLIQASSSTSSYDDTVTLPLAPTSAVSRARKRLRGEPVSPSPSKEKRRRVTPNTKNSFPKLNLDAPGSDDDMDTKDPDSSFVDNSPTKLPGSGKLFPQLFAENELVPTDLFSVKTKPSSTKAKKDNTLELTRRFTSAGRTREVTQKHTRRNSTSAQPELAETYKASTSRTASETPSERSINRSKNKRPASGDGAEDMDVPPRQKSPLIPPSPPPSAAAPNGAFNRSSQFPLKNQGSKSRKRAKIDEHSTTDSDDLEVNAKLKIVSRHETRIKHDGAVQDEDEVEMDSDPILGHARFAGPRASSPETAESGRVEVNLPDQLLRVLALESVAPQSKLPDENRVVKGLLYGRRVSHYNPSKGGEIWDIGEDHHTGMDEQGLKGGEEEDWEGEPVPWEIAEL